MPVDTETPIHLGLMPPLTGLVALYGPEISWAGRIACDQVNAAGGVLGRPLRLLVEDDGSLPESAVPAANRLLDQGCVALIGNLLSNSRIAVASQVADPRHAPYLNFSFYEGSIQQRTFFHFAALPNQQIERMIPYMAHLAGPKMFFAGSNYEWPRGSIDAGMRALRALGGEVVGEAYLPIGSARVDALLDEVQSSGADVFVPYFAGEDQIRLLTGFTRRGLKARMRVVMGHYDEAMAACLPPEVREGFYSCNTYFMSLDTPGNRDYLQALSALPEIDALHPHGTGVLTNFGEGAYLCVHAFAQAANRAGSLDTDALLADLEQTEIAGPQGAVRMDPATHHAHVNSYLARCDFDGRFAIMESFGCIAPAIPARYRRLPRMTEDPPATAMASAGPSATDGLGVAFAAIDGAGCIEYCSRAFVRLWGLDDSTKLVGTPASQLWEDPNALERTLATLADQAEWRGTLNARLADGGLKRMPVRLEAVARTDPAADLYTLICEDRAPLSGADDKSSAILAVADVAVLAVDSQFRIIEANRRASELFGYSISELIGLPIKELLPPPLRSRHEEHMHGFVAGSGTERRMGARMDVHGYRKDGSQFPAEASICKFRNQGEWMLVATLRDITDRRIAEDELIWRATHDALTGLPNRTLTEDRLHNALKRSKRLGHGVALLFIDLDGFKLVNDTHGHAVGDDLLKAIAQLLLDHVRPGDTVARLGGDEFVILCDQVDKPGTAATLAERLTDLLREPVELAGQRLFATASIGLALGHGATHSAAEMLRNADAAMYTAKEHGRDNWRLFSEELHEQARRRLDIANGLRQALARDEFQLRFQPILHAGSQRIQGAELLLRWHPRTGEVSPAHFIPIAELNGTIVPIGKWVFQQACLAEARWRARLGAAASPYISVNLSPRQLNDSTIVETFAGILADSGADPRRLVLELTETAVMQDLTGNLKLLHQLAELGLSMAVDDFGTGYSSLAQLLRLPVNTLKIDREFVDSLEQRDDSRVIVTAVCGMARALNLKTIAEGVENANQFGFLRDLGCDAVQGYYFYRPLSPEDLLAALLAADDAHRDAASDALYAALYISQTCRPLDDVELTALLEQARASNRAQGITGFLLYRDGAFMQLIEGSHSRIRRLLERIAKDPRHRDLRIVFEGPSQKRLFGDWSMGFHKMQSSEPDKEFDHWRTRTLGFIKMSEDARLCYDFIAAFAR